MGHELSPKFEEDITRVLGMLYGNGISTIGLTDMPAVIFVVIGTGIGLAIQLEKG